jgi:DNA repair exonuclease SbcCD ATPase subunit
MLRLKTITVKNFKVFGEYTYNLDNRGLTMLCGKVICADSADSNGAGKTSFFDAISYAMFGKLISGLTANSVINNKTEGGMEVTLIIDKDGQEIKISRFRRDKKYGDSVFLWVDKELFNGDTSKDTQSVINDIIGLSFDLFINGYLFGQGVSKFFTGLPDSGQKEILETILDTKRFSTYLDKTRNLIKDIKKEDNENKQLLQRLSTKKDAILKSIKQLEISNKEYISKIEEKLIVLLTKLESLEIDNTHTDEKLNNDKKELENTLEDLIKEYPVTLQVMEDKLEQVKLEETGYENALKELSYISDIKAEIKLLQDVKYNILSLSGATCSQCGQEVSKDHAAKEILRLINKIASLKNNITEAEDIKFTVDKNLKNIREKKQSISKDITDYSNDTQIKLHNLRYEIKNIQRTIDLNAESSKRSELQYNTLMEEVEHLQADPSPFEQPLKKQNNELSKVNSDIIKVEDKLSNTEYIINDLIFWETAFGSSGIRSLVLDSITPVLNEKANEYSKIMTDGSIRITFNTQRLLSDGKTLKDEFRVDTENILGSVEYKGNSTGERRRIDICVLMALQYLAQHRSNNAINAIFFDEVFESLDKTGRERAMNLLEYISKDFSSIFVISHNDDLINRFDNIITIVKNKEGVSCLES